MVRQSQQKKVGLEVFNSVRLIDQLFRFSPGLYNLTLKDFLTFPSFLNSFSLTLIDALDTLLVR